MQRENRILVLGEDLPRCHDITVVLDFIDVKSEVVLWSNLKNHLADSTNYSCIMLTDANLTASNIKELQVLSKKMPILLRRL